MADLTETGPLRCLAAAVLIRAVQDKKTERTDIMEFWCDVVEIDPDVFFERASRKRRQK